MDNEEYEHVYLPDFCYTCGKNIKTLDACRVTNCCTEMVCESCVTKYHGMGFLTIDSSGVVECSGSNEKKYEAPVWSNVNSYACERLNTIKYIPKDQETRELINRDFNLALLHLRNEERSLWRKIDLAIHDAVRIESRKIKDISALPLDNIRRTAQFVARRNRYPCILTGPSVGRANPSPKSKPV